MMAMLGTLIPPSLLVVAWASHLSQCPLDVIAESGSTDLTVQEIVLLARDCEIWWGVGKAILTG
jgi:hypothetical protein